MKNRGVIVLIWAILSILVIGFVNQMIQNSGHSANKGKSKVEEKRLRQEQISSIARSLRISDSLEHLRIAAEKVAAEKEMKSWHKTKAGRIQLKHPAWSREDCEKIANRMIWIGMSLDMLKYERGLPNHANPSNYGNGTQWQWCWDDYSPSCFYDENNDLLIDSYN
jgi:hypothetical protein